MNRLFIVRHAQPEIDPSFPPAKWPLSPTGRQSARALAFDLGRWSPGLIVVSPERKALETGNEMSAVLDLGVISNDDLQEQGFGSIPFLADPAAFEAAVRHHYRDPLQVVLGDESSDAAGRRLENALDRILSTAPSSNGPPVVVTHGRILASFLSRLTGEDAFAIWKSLRLPDAMMVDLERRKSRARGGIVSEGWQALVNAVVVAMVASLALLIFSGASGRNLAISIALGVLAFVVTYVRAIRS